jgi:DNA-binding winged helix-turn-helix (wHTH) protein
VTESQVKQVVQQLRRVLRDNPRAPHFIETVHRRGYRYIGKINIRDTSTARFAKHGVREPDIGHGVQAPMMVDRKSELAEWERRLEWALTKFKKKKLF